MKTNEKTLQIIDKRIQDLKERKNKCSTGSSKTRINFAITQFKEVFGEIEKA